jgi:hypothetical protein
MMHRAILLYSPYPAHLEDLSMVPTCINVVGSVLGSFNHKRQWLTHVLGLLSSTR